MNNLWQKKIPTFLGFILILGSIILTANLVKNGSGFMSKASPTNLPQDIRITNITDSSFTVSFWTDAPSITSVSYGEKEPLSDTALDPRNYNSLKPYNIHYIDIKNLKASTKYYFSITSNGEKFLNNSSFFETITGPSLENNEEYKLFGNLLLPDGSKPNEASVYLLTENSQALSAFAKNGYYEFNLSNLRSKDLSSVAKIEKPLELLAIDGKMKSEATFSVNQNSSVPPITLSKNYDFTIDNLPSDSSLEIESKFPKYSSSSKESKEPSIVNPEKEEEFIDGKPLFSGTASPSAKIEIVIYSEEIKTEVTADSKGNWSFRPKNNLSSGEHKITIKTKDKNGILKEITRTFTVYAEGSQVNESATPSATPKISLIPTNTPTPIKLELTPTLRPTRTPTLSPTPTKIVVVTKTPPPSVGGQELLVSGIIMTTTIAASILLFLLSRGNISL